MSKPETAGGPPNQTLSVSATEILDLADQCQAEGKNRLAEWLRLEIRHHARCISFQELMHVREPYFYPSPDANKEENWSGILTDVTVGESAFATNPVSGRVTNITRGH